MKGVSHVSLLIASARSWLGAMTHRRGSKLEMEAELANHLESRTQDLMRAGLAHEEAARQARVELGPALKHKEGMRASLGLRWFDELGADLRYAARLLRKSPGFTAIGAVSLALAIGANTAIFSVAKQLLYERLNLPNAAELRLFTWSGPKEHLAVHHIWGDYNSLPGGRVTSTAFSYPLYQQLRAQNRSLVDLFAFKDDSMNATIHDQAQRVEAEMVSGNYYAQLGVQPQLGRAIQLSDDAVQGQGAVAVISDGLWEREFWPLASGDRPVDQAQRHAGCDCRREPKGFYRREESASSRRMSLCRLPCSRLSDPHGRKVTLTDAEAWWVNVMARVRPDVGGDAAQAVLNGQMASIFRGMLPVRKGEQLPQLELADGSRGLFEQKRMFAKPMAVLMTLVGFVLLLACANVANLTLARGAQTATRDECAAGVGRGTPAHCAAMLVESLLLAALGGAGGLVTGYFGRHCAAQAHRECVGAYGFSGSL